MEIKKISNNETDFVFVDSNVCNMLSVYLLRDKDTKFTSCVKTHPHEKHTVLKLITNAGTKSPKEVMIGTINSLIKDIDTIKELVTLKN